MFQGHDRVDVEVAPMVSGYGGQRNPDWTAATTTTHRAEVRVKRSTEASDESGAAVVWDECYLLTGVDVSEDRAGNPGRAVRLRWRDTPYEIEGRPAVFYARGVPHHQRVVMRAVT